MSSSMNEVYLSKMGLCAEFEIIVPSPSPLAVPLWSLALCEFIERLLTHVTAAWLHFGTLKSPDDLLVWAV